MLSVLKFILDCVINFAKMLFTISVDRNLSLGLLMCICFIFFPIVLRVVKFIRQDAIEELDDAYDNSPHQGLFTSSYTGKHEFTGRHSKEYFARRERGKKLGIYYGKHERRYK